MTIEFLNHLVAPSIDPEVMDETRNEGDTASFICQATGEPVPTISWYFNDSVLLVNGMKTHDINSLIEHYY